MNDTGIFLFTVPQAARALGIGRSTVYELIAAGELPVVHTRRSCRIEVAAIEAFIERLQGGESVTPGS